MSLESEDTINEDFNISSSVRTSVAELATLVWNRIHGCDPVFENCEAFEYDVQVRSPDVQKAKDDVALARIVVDYIAGMTDRFALQEYERLAHRKTH